MDDEGLAFFPRSSASRVRTALEDTPVVMVTGPRQCGKTTLVRQMVAPGRAYLTLDDETVLSSALSDPHGLLRGLGPSTIDEVQRAPGLLRAIKLAVDEDRQPGKFLLTGSANLLTLPSVSESLSGRMEIVRLYPLAQSEIRKRKPEFLRSAFEGKLCNCSDYVIGDELVETVLTGGYPEMVRRSDPARRRRWARDYVRSIVERDVRDIAEIEKLDQMQRLLQALALHSGQLTNFALIGSQIGLDDKTARKYIAVLEQLYLVQRLAPWHRNELKRLVKTPKIHFIDSGLLAMLIGANRERIEKDRAIFGRLLETFVFAEVLKQISWLDTECSLFHYRDKDQDEVDIVIEDSAGALIGIEVKASASVTSGDFKGLRKLAEASGKNFQLGLVLYDGLQTVPFGKGQYAAPLSLLWH